MTTRELESEPITVYRRAQQMRMMVRTEYLLKECVRRRDILIKDARTIPCNDPAVKEESQDKSKQC